MRRDVPLRAGAGAAGAVLVWAGWRILRASQFSAVFDDRRDDYARYWERRSQIDGAVLYVAIGDSTAQGIGARHPSGSYVGQLATQLDVTARIVNLSTSGARLSDIISSILPRFARIDTTDALVTFAAGANNVGSFDPGPFTAELTQILDALPPHVLVAELPSFPLHRHNATIRDANAILHALAAERELTVVDLHRATARIGVRGLLRHTAADVFHPNDRGYAVWAGAFLPAARARVAQLTGH